MGHKQGDMILPHGKDKRNVIRCEQVVKGNPVFSRTLTLSKDGTVIIGK
ncbi:hypothetical protein SDC9_205056 [bioreactor metagenome]|uniref:Uncharacterized protein n=1 Tax=bioreactor metagenome TaxID=1076179 RepID=A0A645J2L8_9ZZZZ